MEFIHSIPAWVWTVLLLIVIFAGYALISFNRYKVSREKMLAFQESLKIGDEIILSSGIHGTVSAFLGEQAKIMVGQNQYLIVDRYAISQKKLQQKNAGKQ